MQPISSYKGFLEDHPHGGHATSSSRKRPSNAQREALRKRPKEIAGDRWKKAKKADNSGLLKWTQEYPKNFRHVWLPVAFVRIGCYTKHFPSIHSPIFLYPLGSCQTCSEKNRKRPPSWQSKWKLQKPFNFSLSLTPSHCRAWHASPNGNNEGGGQKWINCIPAAEWNKPEKGPDLSPFPLYSHSHTFVSLHHITVN